MAFQFFAPEHEGPLNRVLVTAISCLALVCATVLLLFGYLRLPLSVSTAAALAIFFAGSLACWKSFLMAQAVLLISLAVSQFVLYGYFDWLLPVFLIVDAAAVALLLRAGQPRD